MSDFKQYGYQILQELSQDTQKAKSTYLAKRLHDSYQVVIKEFQFAKEKGGNWTYLEENKNESKILSSINHSQIPKCIDTFDNTSCMVIQYFSGKSLGESFIFDEHEQIKRIAIQILEILVYLQGRIPQIFHRNIKPENILIDKQLTCYLIDFKFAKLGSDTEGDYDIHKGDLGFTPSKDFILTESYDLYSLGVTLICLISGISSSNIVNYLDHNNELDRSKLEPKLKNCSVSFRQWLDKMTASDYSKRFENALKALEALEPVDVRYMPEINFAVDGRAFNTTIPLEFIATKLGEKITKNITMINNISQTTLEGKWEISYQSQDRNEWIRVTPTSFKGNYETCQITVYTDKLTAQSKGSRQLVLHSNTIPSSNIVTISIVTAPIPKNIDKTPWLNFGFTFLISLSLPVAYEISVYIVLSIYSWCTNILAIIWK